MKDSRITTIFLPITSSKYDYVNSKAYKKVSLRLNGASPFPVLLSNFLRFAPALFIF